MYTGVIQILAAVLFFFCLYHSWHAEGRGYAQQWFAAGYYVAILREIMLLQTGAISYSDQMVKFGSAPSLTTLVIPSLLYIAYVIAQQVAPLHEGRAMLLAVFSVTPALFLPIDATALQFDWWSYPSSSLTFLNGIPYFVPIAWAVTGALFYAFIRFVRRIRLRGSGQLFALVLGAPVVVAIDIALIAVVQLFVGLLALAPERILLNVALVGVFAIMPFIFLVAGRKRYIKSEFES